MSECADKQYSLHILLIPGGQGQQPDGEHSERNGFHCRCIYVHTFIYFIYVMHSIAQNMFHEHTVFENEQAYILQQYALWMITYGTSFPNCSERCQTHATVCGRVMMLVESSASLQMKSCQEMECTIAVKPTNQHFCHSIVTGMLQHSLYVNLTFLSLAAVSPCQSQLGFFFMNQLCDNVFMRLTSDQHVCL